MARQDDVRHATYEQAGQLERSGSACCEQRKYASCRDRKRGQSKLRDPFDTPAQPRFRLAKGSRATNVIRRDVA